MPGSVVARVDSIREELALPRPGAWVPWFPVIDYDRCTNCQQCLGFCLFGVYGVDSDGRVQVQHPENCKTDCPACARVCPSVAVIFPKYGQGPINGDEVRDEDVKRDTVGVDLGTLIGGGDVHAALRARSRQAKERFAAGQGSASPQADGVESLRRAQAELDIPDKVLADLGCGCKCQPPAVQDNQPDADSRPCCQPKDEAGPPR